MTKANDHIVSRFDYARLVRQATMPIIVVWHGPDDYPEKYVARVYDVDRSTSLVAIADTYEELLEAIPTRQMVRLERTPKDNPAIVETWV